MPARVLQPGATKRFTSAGCFTMNVWPLVGVGIAILVAWPVLMLMARLWRLRSDMKMMMSGDDKKTDAIDLPRDASPADSVDE